MTVSEDEAEVPSPPRAKAKLSARPTVAPKAVPSTGRLSAPVAGLLEPRPASAPAPAPRAVRGVLDFHGVLDRIEASSRHLGSIPKENVSDLFHYLRGDDRRELVVTYIGVNSTARRQNTRLEVAKVNRILQGLGVQDHQLLRFAICDRRDEKGRHCQSFGAHWLVDDGGVCIKSAVRFAPQTKKYLVTDRFGEVVRIGLQGEVTAVASVRQALLQA